MKLYDISRPLYGGMLKYPSLRDFEHIWERRIENGDSVNLSAMAMQMHLGTHADAPLHYVDDGKNISNLDLQVFYGTVWVAQTTLEKIGANIVESVPPQYKRILFKTPSSGGAVSAYFSDDAARALKARSSILAGIDSASVDCPKSPGKAVHHILLGHGIAVLEGLDLSDVVPGEYILSAAPLLIRGAEGAPCRAFLIGM